MSDDEPVRRRHVDVVTRLQLSVAHVVFLHVHERRVVIRLAVAVPISADVDVPGIALISLDPVLHGLNCPLHGRLSLARSIDEPDAFRLLLRVQLLADLFQVPHRDLIALRHPALYSRLCQQPGQLHYDLRVQLLQLLHRGLLPYERVLVRVRLDLRPVDEYRGHVDKLCLDQQLHHLPQQVFARLAAQHP